MKYLIKIIPMVPEADLGDCYADGISCDGFVIAANGEHNSSVAIHNVNQMDIATMIAASAELTSASIIAKALREAKTILANEKKGEAAKRLLEKLAGIRSDDDEE